ncbi:MAG: SDR family oxidoreductase [Acidobacteria bacterium]|nr:SDR family oxidoreductase [Acidobacteriota bacterium]
MATNEFTGRRALITGASRGIGRATALALARAGVAHVAIHYNSYGQGAEETLADLAALGVTTSSFQADLTTTEGIQSLTSGVKASGEQFDILVNNAGSLLQRSGLAGYSEDLFDRMINLNVKSCWFLSQAVAPGMIERRSGQIIHVSSIAARNGGGPGATVYASCKGFISTMTKGMAKELAPHGVRVNAVSPGTVDNHFHEVFTTQATLDSMRAATPAGALGTNEEIADTVVFLCSNAARFIYGQTIEINGGLFMI